MSLVATQIQKMRVKSKLDKYELRLGQHGTIDLFLDQTNDPTGIVSRELRERVKKSIGAPAVEVPVINYNGDLTIGNTRTLTIPDSENTSKMIQITFSTYTWGFTMTPSLYDNNEIGYTEDFRFKMESWIEAFLTKLEGVALAQLSTNKTKVLKNPLLFNFAAGDLTADWTQRTNFLRNIDPIMADNKFYGNTDILGDIGIESLRSELAQHGPSNDVNKTNEFANKRFFYTNGMPVSEGKFAQGYAVQRGSLGMLTRFERECYRHSSTPDGHEWDIITLPGTRIPCGTYNYVGVGDKRELAGAASKDMDRVITHYYGFAVDVGFVTPYNSDPSSRANPILGLAVSNTDAVYGKPVQVVGKLPAAATV